MKKTMPHLPKLSLKINNIILVSLILFLCCDSADGAQASERQPKLLIQNGHTSDVTAIAYSPVGSLFASGGEDFTIKVWDAASGRLVSNLTGHSGAISSVSFSPNGQLIVSGSHDGTVRLWDVRDGKLVRVFGEHRSHVLTVAFSPDGRTVASAGGLYEAGSDYAVRLWEVQTGQQLYSLEGHKERVNSVAFSPDGGTVASGSEDATVKFWDVKRGEITATFENRGDDDDYARDVDLVSFSLDGRTFIVADEYSIKIRSTEGGQELRRVGRPDKGYLGRMAISPNRRAVVSGGFYNGEVRLIDLQDGSLLFSSNEKNDGRPAVAISNDGKHIVAGTGGQSLKVWSVENGTLRHTLPWVAASSTAAVYSADGSLLAWANDKKISLWDVQAGKLLRLLDGHSSRVNTLAFSPNGKLLVSGSHGEPVKVWGVADGQLIKTLGGPDLVYAVAFSHDGRTIASSSGDEDKNLVAVNLWDPQTGRLIKNLPAPNPFAESASLRFLPVSSVKSVGVPSVILSIAFSPDDRVLAAGSTYGTVLTWDVQTGRMLRTLEGHNYPVTSVAFSPDGRMIASAGTNIKLWNANNGQLINTIDKHTDYINMLAFSPDGRRLASASNDRTIKNWEVPNGNLLRSFEEHSSGVNSVAFSPDGKMLVTGSIDATTRLWSVETGYLVSTFMTFRNGGWAAYTPDNFFIHSPGAAAFLTWRVGDDLYDISKFREKFHKPEVLVGRSRGLLPPVASSTAATPPTPVRRSEAVSLSVAEDSLREKWKLMRHYALVIGNGAYPAPLGRLQTPLKNAEDVAQILENNYGFEVEMLTNATRDQTLGAIDNYRRTLDDNSSLLIYYAGHGDYEADTGVTHWLPIDATRETATWVSSDDVVNRIRGMKARHVLLVVDSCFSGGFFDSTLSSQPSDEEPIVYLNTMMERVSRFLMTSGDLDFVDEEGEGGHSLFTHAFIQGLKNHQGNIFTARQLFDKHIREYVISNARVNQRPQFGAMANSGRPGRSVNTGNFVFIRKRK